MTRRKKTSGGQAIVMVTVALIAMCGMMGLAVDMGWSFFVQKEAQAVADGAALAAVHEVFERKNGIVSSVGCGNSTNTDAWCKPSITNCSTISSSPASNLYNGCLYAKQNGFIWDNANSRQNVTMQANTTGAGGAPPTTPTGAPLNINGIAYWVTARAIQTVPQLFSSLLGNTTGTVAAVATSAIVAISYPGSFIGLDQEGDCLANGSAGPLTSASLFDCGTDVDLQGSNGQTTCGGSAQVAKLCAPDGVVLASQCNGTDLPTGAPAGSCGASNKNWAGTTANGPIVWAATTIQIKGNGAVQDPANFIPTPTNNGSLPANVDPFAGKRQPPIVSQGQTCELTEPANGSAVLQGNVTLGPFTYYVKLTKNGVTTYGDPITVDNGATVSFTHALTDAQGNSTCPSGVVSGTPGATPNFPNYTFFGGFYLNGNGNSSADFVPGQYVMTGPSQANVNTNSMIYSFMSSAGTITCNACTTGGPGTMFITTDDTYTGSLVKPPALIAAGTTFYQGAVSLKNTSVTLTGIEKNSGGVPSSLDDYDHILVWQDRRNSTDTYYTDSGNTQTDGYVQTPSITALPPAANHVTNSSPAFIMNDGNGVSKYTGVIHQPRGAWLQLDGGNSAINNSPLQVFTGAIYSNGGSGSTQVTLLPVAQPIITYKTALIQ